MDVPQSARMRILLAVERLFSERGFDATATSLIAKIAAVPKGLVFHYFPTKPDLLRALVREHPGIGPIDISALVEPGNPVGSLVNLTNKLFQIQAASEVLSVILWREQRTHPEVKATLIEYRDQIRAVIERVLQASLIKPVTSERLRTAATAWVSILTAHPLGEQSLTDSDGALTDASDAALDDASEQYPALAQLICDGLISRA